MSLNKIMDSSQENINPEQAGDPQQNAEERQNSSKQEPRPSLLDSLLIKDTGGKKLRFLKKED